MSSINNRPAKWLTLLIVVFLLLLWFTFVGSNNKFFQFILVVGWLCWIGGVAFFSPQLFFRNFLSTGLTEKERFERTYKIRAGVGAALGGIAIIAGIFLQWQNLKLEQVKTNAQVSGLTSQLIETQKRDLNEEFSKALNQLGSNNIMVRVGGISTLEQLARTYPHLFYWSTIRAFNVYLKTYIPANFAHPRNAPPSDDIKVILDFYKEGNYERPHHDNDIYDLSKLDLSDVNFNNANFSNVSFSHSILNNTSFSYAQLFDADFSFSHLAGTEFFASHLINAKFASSNLSRVVFEYADLSGANFAKANFSKNKALFWLHNTILYNVDFCTLINPNDLDKFPVHCAKGLTCADVKFAKLSNLTKLPASLDRCKVYRVEDPILIQEKKMAQKLIQRRKNKNLPPPGMVSIITPDREVDEYRSSLAQ